MSWNFLQLKEETSFLDWSCAHLRVSAEMRRQCLAVGEDVLVVTAPRDGTVERVLKMMPLSSPEAVFVDGNAPRGVLLAFFSHLVQRGTRPGRFYSFQLPGVRIRLPKTTTQDKRRRRVLVISPRVPQVPTNMKLSPLSAKELCEALCDALCVRDRKGGSDEAASSEKEPQEAEEAVVLTSTRVVPGAKKNVKTPTIAFLPQLQISFHGDTSSLACLCLRLRTILDTVHLGAGVSGSPLSKIFGKRSVFPRLRVLRAFGLEAAPLDFPVSTRRFPALTVLSADLAEGKLSELLPRPRPGFLELQLSAKNWNGLKLAGFQSLSVLALACGDPSDIGSGVARLKKLRHLALHNVKAVADKKPLFSLHLTGAAEVEGLAHWAPSLTDLTVERMATVAGAAFPKVQTLRVMTDNFSGDFPQLRVLTVFSGAAQSVLPATLQYLSLTGRKLILDLPKMLQPCRKKLVSLSLTYAVVGEALELPALKQFTADRCYFMCEVATPELTSLILRTSVGGPSVGKKLRSLILYQTQACAQLDMCQPGLKDLAVTLCGDEGWVSERPADAYPSLDESEEVDLESSGVEARDSDSEEDKATHRRGSTDANVAGVAGGDDPHLLPAGAQVPTEITVCDSDSEEDKTTHRRGSTDADAAGARGRAETSEDPPPETKAGGAGGKGVDGEPQSERKAPGKSATTGDQEAPRAETQQEGGAAESEREKDAPKLETVLLSGDDIEPALQQIARTCNLGHLSSLIVQTSGKHSCLGRALRLGEQLRFLRYSGPEAEAVRGYTEKLDRSLVADIRGSAGAPI